jgi:hypothetical protein
MKKFLIYGLKRVEDTVALKEPDQFPMTPDSSSGAPYYIYNDGSHKAPYYSPEYCLAPSIRYQEGRFDSNGKCCRLEATVEEVVAEVERCFRDYGGKKGFVFAAFIINFSSESKIAEKNAAIIETANRIRFAGK